MKTAEEVFPLATFVGVINTLAQAWIEKHGNRIAEKHGLALFEQSEGYYAIEVDTDIDNPHGFEDDAAAEAFVMLKALEGKEWAIMATLILGLVSHQHAREPFPGLFPELEQ